jgi:RNA polymerase sigma-70 factor, ECF subfamily
VVSCATAASARAGAAYGRMVYETVAESRSDAELVARVAQGSEGALRELFERHGGAVVALARRMLSDRQDAEEILQDTFLSLHRHAAAFDEARASLRTYLFAIARNLCLTRLRKRSSRPRKLESADPHDVAFQAAVGTDHDLLPGIAVRAALARLEDDERALLEAAFYGGYSHRELAEMHALPLGTVKSRLRRALVKLRAYLDGGAA